MPSNPLPRLLAFLREGVWQTDLSSTTGLRRLGLAAMRVVVHVVRSFSHNVLGLTAAGLTLVSVLAIVPVLGLVFAVGKMFGLATQLDQWFVELGASLPPDAHDAVEAIRKMVAEVNFATLGTVGSITVVWAGLVLFTRTEQALNSVWRTRHRRPWLRRITDFIALVVLVPPLFVTAFVFLSVLRSGPLIAGLSDLEWFLWLRDAGLGLVPYLLLWVAFTALYKLMPSVQVRWRSAFVGGVVAGSALVALQRVYLFFQVGVAQANAIYATLAALPLFLIYLQLMWTVILVGGEVSFAVQNLSSLRGGEDLPPPTFGVRRRVMWHVMHRAAAEFRAGRKGVRLAELCAAKDLPRSWVDDAAELLQGAGLLVAAGADEDLLLPGRPPEAIAMSDLLQVLEGRGAPEIERVSLPADTERRLNDALDKAASEVSGLAF